MSSVEEWAKMFLIFTVVFVVAMTMGFVILYRSRRRSTCPACRSREFDANGLCIACGRKMGEGFEVIAGQTGKDQAKKDDGSQR